MAAGHALTSGQPLGACHHPGLRYPLRGPVLIAARDAAEQATTWTDVSRSRRSWPAGSTASPTRWPGLPAGTVLAAWDFSQGIGGSAITDAGPQGCHGTRGQPAGARHGRRPLDRAGNVLAARAARLRRDPLPRRRHRGLRLARRFTFTVPAGLRSGCYMLHLTCAGGRGLAAVLRAAGRTARDARRSRSWRPPSPTSPTPTMPAATPTPPTRRASRSGTPIPTTPTTTRPTASPPTTATRTAAASRCPPGCGRS